MERDWFTLVTHQVGPSTSLAENWLSQKRQANLKSNQELPDNWIDQYSAEDFTPAVTSCHLARLFQSSKERLSSGLVNRLISGLGGQQPQNNRGKVSFTEAKP
jgi:hypothetical protein